MKTIEKRDQPDGITYGDSSREMWDKINKVSKRSRMVWEALYTMGCKMQELEGLIKRQNAKDNRNRESL